LADRQRLPLDRGQRPLVLGEPGRQRLQHRGHRLAIREQRVRLPVVELEPGGGADLLDGAGRVRDVRQRDGDLVASGGLDLRLGHAELIDARAHDVHGAVERVLVDVRLRRALSLIDELHAALQVEAENGLELCQDDDGSRDQPRHQQQDESVAPAITHDWRWMLELLL
jgi:hypothetical protein